MLTLQKTSDAVPIVGIYQNNKAMKRRKPEALVYFTHEDNEDTGNVGAAKGVLHLHRAYRQTHERLASQLVDRSLLRL